MHDGIAPREIKEKEEKRRSCATSLPFYLPFWRPQVNTPMPLFSFTFLDLDSISPYNTIRVSQVTTSLHQPFQKPFYYYLV